MMLLRTSHRLGIVMLASLLLPATSRASEDPLEHAKNLYLSAAYDEALIVLDNLHRDSKENATEVAQYRVFCLLALDRGDDARKAIAEIVERQPFYHPSEEETAPRIRTVFEDVRRAVLPNLVQHSYADAKAAFDRKDPDAAAQFERVLTLLDDPDLRETPLADLRTVVRGFLDLSRSMVPPVGASTPTNTAASSAPVTVALVSAPVTTPPTDTGFVAPVAISQPMPRWPAGLSAVGRGRLEVLIDEHGDVESVTMTKTIHPFYDAELVKLARTWKFKPGTRNGIATKYSKVIDIQVRPSN